MKVSKEGVCVYELNEVGGFLWDLLEKPRTMQEMQKLLLEDFEIDEQTAQRDIKNFIEQMSEIGSLE